MRSTDRLGKTDADFLPAKVKQSRSNELITVVINTYNESPALLRQCLASVRTQSFDRFQCVVVDDASDITDPIAAVEELRGDARFEFVRNDRNVGLAASRNIGLGRARGLLVTFLDADDFLYPESLSERLGAIKRASDNGLLAGSFCNWAVVQQSATPSEEVPRQARRKPVTWLDCIDDNIFVASAPLFSTQAARRLGGFDETLVTAEDYAFWAKMLRHGYALTTTDHVGVGYRQKRTSMFRTTARQHVDTQIAIYEWNYHRLPRRARVDGTPFVFVHPPARYRLGLDRARRLTVGVVNALHSGDDQALRTFSTALASEVEPWMWWAINWRSLIRKTAERLELYDEEGFESRRDDLLNRATRIVFPILRRVAPL